MLEMKIKRTIAILINWKIEDFDLIHSGTKRGRPNWEVVNRNNKRFAFTAFDSSDIDGLHEVII